MEVFSVRRGAEGRTQCRDKQQIFGCATRRGDISTKVAHDGHALSYDIPRSLHDTVLTGVLKMRCDKSGQATSYRNVFRLS